MTELEKGYVAGLIDGEGTISLQKVHSTDKFRAPCIEMTSTTLSILEKMKELAGGSISKQKVYKENWKQSWHWQTRYNKAIDLLAEIKDYLLEPKKSYRANLIVNEYKNVTPRNGNYNEEKLAAKLDFEERFFKEIIEEN